MLSLRSFPRFLFGPRARLKLRLGASSVGIVLGVSLVAAACGGSGSKSEGDPDAARDSASDDADGAHSADAARSDAGSDDAGGPTDATPTNTGSACSSDDQCTGAGTNRCLTVVQEYTFPEGYCTTTCESDDACGPDGLCPLAPLLTSPLLPLLPANIQSAIREFSSCFRACTRDADCREADGYHCGAGSELFPSLGQLGVDTSALYCLPPSPSAALDAGAGSDAGGDAGGALDAGEDAGTGAGADAGADAGVDAGLDASVGDAGPDAASN